MSEEIESKRYKKYQGKRWIEVRVKSPLQLFDSRDPAPFHERDLDDDFIEYIVSAAREFSYSSILKIIIYIEEPEEKNLPQPFIKEAIHSFLAYQIDLQRGVLRSFVKRTQIFLVIGILILVACLMAAQSIEVPTPPGAYGILREGLIIFGWVSIWKPIEVSLFDWYPLYEKIRFYRKLLNTELDIRFGAENTPPSP